jgi:isoleucyl-tRNA synthetase
VFQAVSPRPDYAELENAVLRLWAETRAFEQLRAQTCGGPKWSFLDGPITANNPMGLHHAWGRTYKDLYNRYHVMLGHELRWQQGFDCQGLWVEVEVEKELGFKDKRQIEAYGVANFVNACKERVYRFAAVQTEQSKRLGYWMDWGNSYYTLSDENNYSIWAFLKRCHEQGWLYRGHDVMPWCPRCSTALSEHEIATEGYAEKTHLALTVAFPLLDRPGEALLAWTTTPWTLPANVAAAVHPELLYVHVTMTNPTQAASDEPARSFWLAQDALSNLPNRGDNMRVEEERCGADLVGWRYTGPFADLEAQRDVMPRVVPWTEISATEGTGVVHLAPGAGKEDFALGRDYGLPVLAPLDDDGVYVAGYDWLSGRKASDVATDVAADLQRRELLFDHALYTHRYPVCWRCGTELVFRLVDEWFIAMDQLRQPMMDAARTASWIPSFGLDRELDWLRNMNDWMISKKRYWGLALPIYRCAACDHVTVVGSQEELRERAVAGWEQFEGHSPHRPWVDAVQIACPQCNTPVARVLDVGNPWLDAGIVAFSTLNYRRDRDYWAQWFPADLVLESFPGQFRNWFYALLAMSVALDGRAPFKTLLGYATVLDEHGAEMHKSKGNSLPFETVADWMGVEPLRWIFANAPLERNLHFGRSLVEEATRKLQPLWEVYRFFVTYANLDDWKPVPYDQLYATNHRNLATQHSALDQWLLARLDQLVQAARERLHSYDARGFTLEVEAFLDELSNWYVRRSRRRFWSAARSTNQTDKQSAYATLYTTLVTLARLLAPVLPFLSEALYQNLVRSAEPNAPVSVHLTGYPEAPNKERAELTGKDAPGALLDSMDVARRVVSLGRVARKQAGLRVRQPLGKMLVVVTNPAEHAALLRHHAEVLDELNVKTLDVLTNDTSRHGELLLLQYRIKPNLRLLGPQLGKALPALRTMLEQLEGPVAAQVAWAVAAQEPITLPFHAAELTFVPGELLVEAAPLEGYAVAQDNGLQVALDLSLDEALRREGLARDLVRAVQEVRKNAGMSLSDRIDLYLDPGEALAATLTVWEDYLRAETLAETVSLELPPPNIYAEAVMIDGALVTIGLARSV